MRRITTEVKVGIFALIVMGILSLMTFWVGGLSWLKKPGYRVYVYFNNVSGLETKSKIRVAGVEAGYIEAISLVGGKAKLTLRVNKGVTLYSDADAGISSMGLLGEKYLELKPGSTPPVLKDGGAITGAIPSVDMDQLFRKLSSLSDSLSKIAGKVNEILAPEQINALKSAINNVKTITDNVNNAVVQDNAKVRTALDNVNSLIATLNGTAKQNSKNITELIANLKDLSRTLDEEAPGVLSNIRDTSTEIKKLVAQSRPGIENIVNSTSRITSNLREGKGTLGKLLTDQTLYNNLNSSVKNLNQTFGAINRFKVYLNFEGRYFARPGNSEGRFLLTLQPKPNKSYIFGVVSNPVSRIDKIQFFDTATNQIVTTSENVHSDYQFIAQFARRFGGTALRIGVMDSTFGAGADQFFDNDRLKLSLDAWDFQNKEAFAKHAHVRVGADYFLFKHIYLSGGWDNPLNAHWSSPYVGGGIRFEDEDLKYLFGAASIKP